MNYFLSKDFTGIYFWKAHRKKMEVSAGCVQTATSVITLNMPLTPSLLRFLKPLYSLLDQVKVRGTSGKGQGKVRETNVNFQQLQSY